jgi:hypothetical protein
MNGRTSWLIVVVVLAGCGEQENAKLASPHRPAQATEDSSEDRTAALLDQDARPTQTRDDLEAVATERLINDGKSWSETSTVYTEGEAIAAIRLLGGQYKNNNERLSLVGPQFTDTEVEYVKWLTTIERLILRDTQVTDAGLTHISGLASLRRLDLAGTQITDVGLEHLNGLRRLSNLSLQGTQVTDAGLQDLRILSSLAALNLSETQITDVGLEHLEQCPGLRTLQLQGTQITEGGLEALRAALPDCTIQ